MISPLNADVEKSISLHQKEWKWLKNYFSKHRQAPPQKAFADHFKEFPIHLAEATIEFYIDEVHRSRATRDLKRLILDASTGIGDEGPYATINKLNKELSILGRETRMVRDLDLVANADERLESLRERLEMRRAGRKILGVPTGFSIMDHEFGGYQPGDMVVIAAWSSQGKSWLALYSALNAWKEGYRVLYISMEMSGLQIGYRMDSLLSGGLFPSSNLMHAKNVVYDNYKTWLGDCLKNKPPFVVVTNENLEEINQNTILSKIEMWKPQVVVIDYHQLVDDVDGNDNETVKTKKLSKAFKRMAVQTGTAIINISSVTMDGDQGERPPELSELSWSKQLAFDSDACLALCKQGDVIEVACRKNRRGKLFHFYLDCDFERGTIKEVSPYVESDDN